jgi:hypothetical protein
MGKIDKNRAKQMSAQSLGGLPDATSRKGKTSDDSLPTSESANRTMLFDVPKAKGSLNLLARYGVNSLEVLVARLQPTHLEGFR